MGVLPRHFLSSNTSDVSTGYLPLTSLKELDEEARDYSKLDVAGVRIGDTIESVVSVFGRDFNFIRDTYYKAMEYEGIVFVLTDYGYYVTEIHLIGNSKSQEEYPMHWDVLGVKPGMYLYEAIDLTENSFERYYDNVEMAKKNGGFEPFIEYDIGNNYVLTLNTSSWTYDDKTYIKNVSIDSNSWIFR